MSTSTHECPSLATRYIVAPRDGERAVGRQHACHADAHKPERAHYGDGAAHEREPWEGLRYERLMRFPKRFSALTGVSVATFNGIVAMVMPHYAEAERQRLNTAVRLRAHGGGRPAKLTPQDRILMAVVWLRHHPTHEALAALFQIDHSNVTRLLSRLVSLLERTRQDMMRQADPGKNKRPGLAALQPLLVD